MSNSFSNAIAESPQKMREFIGDAAYEELFSEEPLIQGEEVEEPQSRLLDVAALRRLNKSDKGKKLIQKAKDWYRQDYDISSERRREWELHEAFERGDQYSYVDKKTGKLGTLPITGEDRTRVTVNKIRGIMRTEVAKLTAQKPTATAMPASDSDEDIKAAKAADVLWESLYLRLKVASKFRRAARWSSLTGLGFLKVWWDPGAYDRTSKMYGDIRIESIPPHNIFVPDIFTEELEEQPHMIHAYTQSVERTKLMYSDILGKNFELAPRTDVDQQEFKRKSHAGSQKQEDSVLVLEVWVKPGFYEDFPEGGFLVIIDDYIVEASLDGFPEGYEEYPIAKIDHIQTGTFYPACVLDDAISVQRQINHAYTQMVKLKNQMITNGLMYQDGSLDPEQVTNAPGQLIPITPGSPFPQQLRSPDLPPHIVETIQRLEMKLEDISGQHASTAGRHVPGLEAATAIGMLLEQDEAYITPAIASIEEAAAKVARTALNLFVEYVDTERTVRAVGDDNTVEVLALSGADIAGGTDVRVEDSSALPTSRSARQALFMDLAKLGTIQGSDVLDLLEVPQLGHFLDKMPGRVDEKAAANENMGFKKITEEDIEAYEQEWQQRLAAEDPATMSTQTDPETGDPIPMEAPPIIPVNEWDNHEIHIEVHERVIKSQWFKSAPDRVKAELVQHWRMHRMAMQNQMMEQMMMEGAIPPPPMEEAPEGAAEPAEPGYIGMSEEQLAEMGE